MNEIYWIQRMGEIHVLAWVVFIIALIAAGVLAAGVYVERDFIDTSSDSKAKYEVCLKGLKIVPWIIGASAIVGVFVPSERQLYAIYGIGGTIDYIRSNDTAKQLPDKVVNALDAWLDNQTENEKKD